VVDTQTYHIATNSFLSPGGDGFTAFTEGENRQVRGGFNLSDAVIDYLKKGNPITPERMNQIRVQESQQ
jgi:2',3'-cyclic-nucleotide 2'-phosphodiesterase (5'-nucleotidase family)